MPRKALRVRQALGPGPQIAVLSGHMPGDTEMIHDLDLTPMLNSLDQITRHLEALPGHPFGVQLDTGMNRLGVETLEWEAVAPILIEAGPELLMSHLACADEPDHPMNEAQLHAFHAMTDGTGLPRSLAATGGILLGPRYHFDLTRPGVGLYGGLPFDAAPAGGHPVPAGDPDPRSRRRARRWAMAAPGRPRRPSVIATVAGGYADGLPRTLSNRAHALGWRHPLPAGRPRVDGPDHGRHHPSARSAARAWTSSARTRRVDDLAEIGGHHRL